MIDKAAGKLKSDGWTIVETSGFLHLIGYDHENDGEDDSGRKTARHKDRTLRTVHPRPNQLWPPADPALLS